MIQAPPQAVYEYVCDFPRHPEWNHQPMDINMVTEGPIEVGSVFRTEEQPPAKAPWHIRTIILPLMWKIVGFVGYTEAEITAMEPGRRLAWEASAPLRNGGYWLKADYEILLEERNGATHLTQRYHYISQHKLSQNVASDRAAQSIAEEVDGNLARLKEIVESGARQNGR